MWLECGSWRCCLLGGDGSAACRWLGAQWVRASQPGSQNSAEVQWTAHECKIEWQTLSSQDCLSHPDFPAFIIFQYLNWWPVTSSCWSNAIEGANPPTLILLWSARNCFVFFNQKRSLKAAASHIWLLGLQRLTGTAGCGAGAAALPSQPQREPNAGSMLHWGSQLARAMAVGVPDLGVICFVPQLLCGDGVSRLYSLQAENKERFCISMCVCGIPS